MLKILCKVECYKKITLANLGEGILIFYFAKAKALYRFPNKSFDGHQKQSYQGRKEMSMYDSLHAPLRFRYPKQSSKGE